MAATRLLWRATTVAALLLGGLPDSSYGATYDLLVSSSSTRSSPAPLQGKAVSGNTYVFVGPENGVTRVLFYLDDANRSGSPRKTEANAPWDFAGTAGDTSRSANPFDTRTISNGSHTITAAIDLSAGGTQVVSSTFTVDNGAPAPTPPDQVHLAWVGNPSTTLTVIWRTRSTDSSSTVQYRPLGTTTWKTAGGVLRPSGTSGSLHQAKLGALTAATEYEYRVPGDGGALSQVFKARTAPAPGHVPFDAVYVADTGIAGRADGLATGTLQVRDEIKRLDPLLILPGGDYAYFDGDKRFGTLNATIDAWFNQQQPLFSRAPAMPTYGNHEVLLGEGFAPWAARFATPAGFDGRRNYSFDVGDVHFVSILAVQNPGGLSSATLSWLEQDITAAKGRGQRWVIPYMHVPAFSDGSSHGSNLELRAQLGPLFERLGVKIVLSSHDQSYERTYPLVDVPASNTPTSTSRSCYTLSDGVSWVKISPGGKLSNKGGDFSQFLTYPPPSYTAFRDNTMHHFVRVRVRSNAIRLEAYGVKGDGSPPILQDSFEYRTVSCGPTTVGIPSG